VIYTIGHGNRSIEEFVGLLRDAAIECLVDVRAYPASRRHPQFARASLESSLADAGIRYVWEGTALGGRRKPEPNSPHVALKNPGFRAYADHMTSETFREGLARLIGLGSATPAAIMCAERLPWDCHRFLISDSMVARRQEVVHLINPGSRREHVLSAIARMRGGDLLYDGAAQRELGL
jgi:uncharacterized protein (DUF488 family)